MPATSAWAASTWTSAIPSFPATPEPITTSPSRSWTRPCATLTTENVGRVTLVRSSVLERPESETATRSGVDGGSITGTGDGSTLKSMSNALPLSRPVAVARQMPTASERCRTVTAPWITSASVGRAAGASASVNECAVHVTQTIETSTVVSRLHDVPVTFHGVRWSKSMPKELPDCGGNTCTVCSSGWATVRSVCVSPGWYHQSPS